VLDGSIQKQFERVFSYRLSFHPMNSSLALLLFIALLLPLLDDPLGLPAIMGYVPGMYMPPDDP
jgi:hypothetical protein